MQELITVIINVYNGEKFIEKCLNSVINQTYKNLEILIINDGSTDNTLKLCEKYEDERIKIITTQNLGLSMSRNIGIDKANGEYLYFIDVDDWIELDTIEYLYNICKKYNTKMSTCKCIDVYDYNVNIINKQEKVEIISSLDMLKKVLLSVDRAVTVWNKLIKKELFNDIRFENKIINDVRVTHKLIIEANKIAYSNQKKYYYLRHRNAITVKEKKNTKRLIDKYEAIIDRYNYIKKVYPDFIENDIGFLKHAIKLYLVDDEELQKFLDEQDAEKYIKKLFSYKMLFKKITIKSKMLFIMFKINPKFCKYINNKYQGFRYKYKI